MLFSAQSPSPPLFTSLRGIGAAIAIKLGERGANVVVNYTSDKSQPRAEEVVKKIEAAGSKAVALQSDVTKMSEIPRILDTALKLSSTGKIEILVHK